MRGMLSRLVPVLACSAALATQATAQEMDRRLSRFDLGVYAGGTLTSDWFESRTVTLNGNEDPTENDDDEGFSPGTGGAFGALATFWFTPALGLRAHAAYLPMRLPNSDDEAFDNDTYVMNTYVADLNLALRPFSGGRSPLMSSLYLFVGGGGLMVDLAGEDGLGCEGALFAQGACLSTEPEHAAVGQGTAGLGVDLFPIGGMLALFGEAAVHVYDSPVHVGDAWLGPIRVPTGSTVRVADDATAVTGRLVIGLKAMFGNWIEAPVAPPPPPPPPPIAPPPPPPPPPPANPMREIRVCVVEGGALREATAMYNTQTGDTTWTGGPQSMTGYAAGAPWFINNEPVTVMGRRYVRYGLPRVLGINDVSRVADYQGIPVFAEAGMTGTPEVLYVPVRPGCEFQPYQLEVKAGGVRGD